MSDDDDRCPDGFLHDWEKVQDDVLQMAWFQCKHCGKEKDKPDGV